MRFHATFASAAMAVAFAVTPAFAAKITVSQYGRLVATLPWAVALEKGMFRHRTVAAGEPGTPGNFILEMVRTTDDFFSPRHRHNFDQFRYQLEGEFDFDRNGKMAPGIIGYFPEGTPYGPQSSSVSSLTLVLQFGGASGNGYMTQQQMEAGHKIHVEPRIIAEVAKS